MMKFRNIILLIHAFLVIGCSSGGGYNNNNGNNTTPIFSQAKYISNTSNNSKNPVIAADADGNVYVGWEETFPNPHPEIYFAKSANSGDTFTSGKSLTTASSTDCSQAGGMSMDASMGAGKDDEAYLIWLNAATTGTPEWRLKFLSEEDTLCKYLSLTGGDASSPLLKVDAGGNIHVVWAQENGSGGEKDIFYRFSSNNGVTFNPSSIQPPLNISSTPSDSDEPLLGVEGSFNVDIVWSEGTSGGRGVSFSRSTDGGYNFTSPQTMSDTGIDAHCPVIATSGVDKVYVAYRGDSSTDAIYFSRLVSGTSSFSGPVNISTYSNSPSCPEMAVGANGIIYVVWSDGGEIWAAVSSDGGYSFSAPENVSGSSGAASSSPEIAVDGNYVNIIWVEDMGGKGEIYFSGSVDNGTNFSSPYNISSTPAARSDSPVIAVERGKYVYVAWTEGAEGSGEIYFVKGEGARGISSHGKRSFARFNDFSGDGKSDIVIGAPEANGKGEVYLFYSNSIQGSLDGSDIAASSAGKTLFGESYDDQFGFSAAIAGDINGDGYADIIAGAPYADSGGGNSGKVYIYYGGPSSSMDTVADVTISGSTAGDNFGLSVSPAGDVNGDGLDDIIIGAPNKYQSGSGYPYAGTAFIFFGGPLIGGKSGYPGLSSDDADVILNGENSHDNFGSAVSWSGDFNGDGYDDVVVGAPNVDGEGKNRGRAYIFYGGTSMNSAADVKITGGTNLDKLGSSVARGGDVNGDGYGDVIIGAPNVDVTGTSDAGRVYVVYGGSFVASEIDVAGSGSSLTVLSGSVNKGHFGFSVGYADDVNGDGYSDVLVGGLYQGLDETFIGRAYVYLGGQSMDTSADVTFIGVNQSDSFGSAVAGAGDVTGDGYYDVIIGAYLADTGTSENNRGRTYLYLGDTPKPDASADATFTGSIDDGWAGYSLYKSSQ